MKLIIGQLVSMDIMRVELECLGEFRWRCKLLVLR